MRPPTLLLVLVALVAAVPLSSSDAGWFSTSATYNPPSSHELARLFKRRSASPDAWYQYGRYTATFSIGNPPTPYQLIVDTGSADTWLFTRYVDAAALSTHVTYPYTKGQTNPSALAGCTFSMGAFDGTHASGDCMMDVVTVGQSSDPGWDVEKTFTSNVPYFGVATSVTDDDHTIPVVASGFAGYGWISAVTWTMTGGVTKNLFDTIANTSTASAGVNQLGMYFPYQRGGTFDWGGSNTQNYCANCDLTPVKVTDDALGFWSVPATQCKWSIDGTWSPTQKYSQDFVIIDSGAALLYLDNATVAAYYGAVKEVNGHTQSDDEWFWTFDCSQQDKLPVLSLELDGKWLDIPPHIMKWVQWEGTDRCVGALQAAVGIQHLSYGITLLNAYYGFFDRGAGVFSYAKIADAATWPP